MDDTGLKVVNHRLAGIRYQASPNHSGKMTPRLGVIHYTAGSSMSGAIGTLCNPNVLASAHVVIGVGGEVVQLVPFDTVAWHAGPSEWRGAKGCNQFSIGIELVNPGYLAKVGISAKHRNGGPVRTWGTYPDLQVSSCIAVAKAINEAYPVTEWVGHDDIAPGRKSDPGPAWDWVRFRAGVYNARGTPSGQV